MRPDEDGSTRRTRTAPGALALVGAAARIADEMRRMGLGGPVLVIADSAAVSRLAPTWAEAFAGAGWVHRVIGFGGTGGRREIAALAREAASLGAVTILGAGGREVLDAAAAVASATSAGFVGCPI